VLATPETQWPYHDTYDQIVKEREYEDFTIGPGRNYKVDDLDLHPLGRVIAVLRVGGRHKHWDALIATANRPAPAPEANYYQHRQEVREDAAGESVE
jgi:hypothetical protein